MAVPAYTTDLQTISLCEVVGTWDELDAAGWTQGGADALDDDNPIQNTYSISKSFNAIGVGGLVFDYGSGITFGTDEVFSMWVFWASPAAIQTYANGGIRLIRGSDDANFYSWDVGGSDTYAYGGWINIACTTDTAVHAADDTVDTPTTTKQWFGAAVNVTNSIFKGNPFLVDAVRYGRAESRIAGGSVGDGYATFAGYAAENDSNLNMWGLIQAIDGGYLVKGLTIFGYTTLTEFVDENTSILIQDTKKVSANFNTFEVRQTGSTVDLTAISFTALGTQSPGRWVTTDNATQNITNCVFTGMGVFGYGSNATILGTIYRGCSTVTQESASITSCVFENSTASSSLVSNNLSDIDGCTFVSDGSNHAIELTAIGEYDLTNHTFTDYATSDGSTGNEVIFNDSGGEVTLNSSGNSGIISVRNGSGASTIIVASPITTTITVKDIDTQELIVGARVLVSVSSGVNFPYEASITITRSGAVATVSHTAHGLSTDDKILVEGSNQWEYNGVHQITYIGVDSYSYTVVNTPTTPATGTITATMVIIDEVTNGSGIANDTRTLSNDQPISGTVRHSSSPYYKDSPISFTISSSNGYTTTVQLIPDE